jgi:hypothetical protein
MDCEAAEVYETLLIIFQIHGESENAREANEMYDDIKEGGSTRILGHLMRAPALGLYKVRFKYLVKLYFQ